MPSTPTPPRLAPNTVKPGYHKTPSWTSWASYGDDSRKDYGKGGAPAQYVVDLTPRVAMRVAPAAEVIDRSTDIIHKPDTHQTGADSDADRNADDPAAEATSGGGGGGVIEGGADLAV